MDAIAVGLLILWVVILELQIYRLSKQFDELDAMRARIDILYNQLKHKKR